MTTARAAVLLACVFGTAVPASARAETVVGLELDGGGATITAPDDAPGEPTLLYGTALTGPALRVAGTADRTVAGPLSVGLSLGFGRYAMSGFAERDGLRRELDLRLSCLEVLARLRVGARDGLLRPFGGVGVGGRFGLTASSKETRVGFVVTDGAPAVETANAAIVALEGGVIVAHDRIRIPIAAVATRNLSYGGTTRDRLEGYRNVALPGALVVDATWTYGLRVGVGWAW